MSGFHNDRLQKSSILVASVPPTLRLLHNSMLQRNPKQRPDATSIELFCRRSLWKPDINNDLQTNNEQDGKSQKDLATNEAIPIPPYFLAHLATSGLPLNACAPGCAYTGLNETNDILVKSEHEIVSLFSQQKDNENNIIQINR
ncbi:MAG: hypothetical protein EZS28_050144 [Streblomastix strix]|uniref:Uncharacterized protein n=1 Tax=Streblomastix strix TaxID=222440 RepID=A0A5J4T7V0_9EUKA|nr:MAG: hypothetical protein EZS28_050144 [Streblomastix strix]